MCAILAPKAMDYISPDNIKFFVYCKHKIPNPKQQRAHMQQFVYYLNLFPFYWLNGEFHPLYAHFV